MERGSKASVYWGQSRMPILEGRPAITAYDACKNLFKASTELLGDLRKRGILQSVENQTATVSLDGGGCYSVDVKPKEEPYHGMV